MKYIYTLDCKCHCIGFLVSCSFDLDSQTWSITEPALNSQVLKNPLNGTCNGCFMAAFVNILHLAMYLCILSSVFGRKAST